jgi:hypothetical protein
MKEAKITLLKNLTQLEVWPVGDYRQYLAKNSIAERINQHWYRVGNYFCDALTQYDRQRLIQK